MSDRKQASQTLAEIPVGALALYDTACRALAEAVRVDEVKNILDVAVMMRAYARQAKNREAEADAVALRMRATRRLDQLRQAQKETVGLNTGTRGQLSGGLKVNPPGKDKPTLAQQGIDKALAHDGRVLGRMSEADFERKVADARSSASRVYRRVVREAEIEQEREERRARTATGGTVADLYALIASGFRAGVIAADPPWPFTYYSERSAGHVTEHYDTMTLDAIKALPVAQLAADVCALFLWCTWPNMLVWREVIEAWGFTYSGLGFDWVKLKPNGEGLHIGQGYGTRSNPEPCLLAKRGNPLRLDAGVHSVIMPPEGELIMTPVGEHSEKPDEAYARMQWLYPGPYLELFARREREGWITWGDEIIARGALAQSSREEKKRWRRDAEADLKLEREAKAATTR